MLTTVAYRIGGRTTYAMEGSIFIAGAAVKWLRDGLKVIGSAAETATAAAAVPDDHGVYLVPAFVGLGAPHWDPAARGLHLRTHPRCQRRAPGARGARVGRLPDARSHAGDGARRRGARGRAIRIDGGMAGNDWFCQFLADMLEARVERPAELETTALGAAFLAGLATGVWPDLDALSGHLAQRWRVLPAHEPGQARAAGRRLAAGRAPHAAAD